MRSRVLSLLSQHASEMQSEQPYAGTFHSLCANILRRHAVSLGMSPNFVIYDASDQLSLIKQIMTDQDISQRNFNPRAVLHTISEVKNELITPLEYVQFARGHFQETVAHIYRLYQDRLAENEAVDFDDLLMKTVMLLRTHTPILNSYQEQFRYIMVDEYQDTNKAQYMLSKLLSARYRNICVVGDASQSIYRWRGADFRNITNFKKDFPDAVTYHLEQNYRSTQRVLDAAYGIIEKNRSHPILKLWTDNPQGEKITVYEARNELDEAQFLTQTILQSGRPFSDFAVLYRTNAQSRVVEEAFLHVKIPYHLVGGTRFYDRREIKDIVSYLRVLANPKDSVSYKRLEKIGKRKLKSFETFAEGIRGDSMLISYTTLELLDRVVEAADYLSQFDPHIEEDAGRLENIKELRSVAMEFPHLHGFLENVSLMEAESKPSKANRQPTNAVTLMTMHAAKGLEFPIVFIVGLEEGLFPHSRTLMDSEELEEERRLCYVAITRAKEQLYLTYANQRLVFGTKTNGVVSRFVADIPEDTLAFHASLSPLRGFSQDDLLL